MTKVRNLALIAEMEEAAKCGGLFITYKARRWTNIDWLSIN